MSEAFGLEGLMVTLHDRLAELADDAPTGAAPAAELWARGRRAHRVRAAVLAVSLLATGVVGAGIGVRVVDGDDNRSVLSPSGNLGFALPITYPAGEQLPSLGRTPGPLAAVWTDPRPGGAATTAVGLVAATGKFGTLPIDLPEDDDPQALYDVVELSPDGRRIAYTSSHSSPGAGLMVRDLVTGETYSPLSGFQAREWTWVDATHLVGRVAGGSDADGWVWEPGQAAERVNPYPWLEGYRDRDLWVFISGNGPRACSAPTVASQAGRFDVPALCDVLGFIGSDFVLG